jgi:hypothetical protein
MAGVKWDIDVEAKAGSAGAAAEKVGDLGKVLKKTESAAQANAAEIKRLNFELARMHAPGAEEIARLNKELGHLKNDHHSVFAEVFSAELAKDALEKVLEKVIEIGTEAIKSAASEERMMRVFESHAGSKELGEQNELWTDILAKKTEFTEKQTEGAFIDLKTVGASDQEAKLALKAAADIAAVSKNKNEAFSSTIEAFSRLQRTGVVSNRTLAPLGIGVKDFKTLDSMKGLSDKAIAKRMEEGKIDRSDLFKLIMSRAHETSIGEKAAGNADLLGTKMEKLQELPERFFKKLGDTKAIKTLSTAIDGVLQKLDPDSPTGKKISGFLETAFEGAASLAETIGSAIDNIDFESVADTIKNDVVPALKTMIGWIKPVVDEVQGILSGLHSVYDLLHSKGEFAKYNDRNLRSEDPTAGLARVREAAGKSAAKSVTVGDGAKAWHGAFHIVGAAGGDGLAEGLDKKRPKVKEHGAAMAAEAPAGAKETLQVESPSVVFEDIGAMTAAGFIQGIEAGSGDVERAVSRAFDVRPPAGGRGGGGSSAGSPSMVIQQVVINVDGGKDGGEQGRRAADAFDARVRALWISMLEQAKLEAGA